MIRLALVGALALAGVAGCRVANPAYEAHVDGPDGSPARPDGQALSPDGRDGGSGAGIVSLATGLVGFWRFDEGVGVEARDSSGQRNHGRLVSLGAAPWAPGRVGGTSVTFAADQSDPRVEVPASISLDGITEGVTAAAWVWPGEVRGDGFRMVLSRQRAGTNGEHYGLGFLGDVMGLYLTGEAFHDGPAAGVALPPSTWTHVAATYDGALARLFVNGREVDARALVTGSLRGAAVTPMLIGNNRNAESFGEAWVGRLDDVALYARALSAEEIRRLAEGDLPPVR